MKLSPCGADCGACHLKEEHKCDCRACEGKPFYIRDFADICPMYDCAVNKKGYESCAECSDLPCKIFYDWKDPNMTEEAHVQSINERVKVLKENNS